MVAHHHQVARLQVWVDTSRHIRNYNTLHTQRPQHPNGEGDLLHAPAFVPVKATSHYSHRVRAEVAENKFTGVAFDGAGGEVGEGVVGDFGLYVDVVDQIAQAGAEHNGGAGLKICLGSDGGYGFLNLFVKHCWEVLSVKVHKKAGSGVEVVGVAAANFSPLPTFLRRLTTGLVSDMKNQLKYKRILLKLSGESLMGVQKFGITADMLQHYAWQIKGLHDLGVEVCVVIGGGNIFRGIQSEGTGIEPVTGDYMGMLATVINGLALQGALEGIGIYTRLMTALKMESVAEPYIRRRAIRHLEKGRVVICAAGTGNPFFTTDSAAALRANEINADVILKGTRVDGIYTADPEKDPTAVKFDHLTFAKVISLGLEVMDMTAFTLCRENAMPIIVFDINQPENLVQIVQGASVGTLVSG